MFTSQAGRLTALAAGHRLPTMGGDSAVPKSGGLASYAPNTADMLRGCAVLADKILKGAKPADLPVEQPTKFELVVNLKTARRSASPSRNQCCSWRIRSYSDSTLPNITLQRTNGSRSSPLAAELARSANPR
jgi:hypothetical protein